MLRQAVAALELLGQAEVGDLGRAVLGQQELAGLRSRWTMPWLVGVLHGPGQRLHQARGLGGRLRLAGPVSVCRLPPSTNSSAK